jgi:hypothetical protein
VKHRANHLTGVLSTEDLRHTLRHPKQEEQQDYRSHSLYDCLGTVGFSSPAHIVSVKLPSVPKSGTTATLPLSQLVWSTPCARFQASNPQINIRWRDFSGLLTLKLPPQRKDKTIARSGHGVSNCGVFRESLIPEQKSV